MSLAVAACSNNQASDSALKSIEQLSAADPSSNADKLRQLVEQQCFDRLNNLQKFEAGLTASGWPIKRTQSADANNELALDGWEAPGLTLLRGQPVNGGVWTCTLMVKPSIAPTANQMQTELSKLVGGKPDASDGWWWKRARDNKIHMDVETSAEGLVINVENYHLAWWKSLME